MTGVTCKLRLSRRGGPALWTWLCWGGLALSLHGQVPLVASGTTTASTVSYNTTVTVQTTYTTEPAVCRNETNGICCWCMFYRLNQSCIRNCPNTHKHRVPDKVWATKDGNQVCQDPDFVTHKIPKSDKVCSRCPEGQYFQRRKTAVATGSTKTMTTTSRAPSSSVQSTKTVATEITTPQTGTSRKLVTSSKNKITTGRPTVAVNINVCSDSNPCCVIDCGKGFYGDDMTMACETCFNEKCMNCTNGTKAGCTWCTEDMFLHKGDCVDECPEGWEPSSESAGIKMCVRKKGLNLAVIIAPVLCVTTLIIVIIVLAVILVKRRRNVSRNRRKSVIPPPAAKDLDMPTVERQKTLQKQVSSEVMSEGHDRVLRYTPEPHRKVEEQLEKRRQEWNGGHAQDVMEEEDHYYADNAEEPQEVYVNTPGATLDGTHQLIPPSGDWRQASHITSGPRTKKNLADVHRHPAGDDEDFGQIYQNVSTENIPKKVGETDQDFGLIYENTDFLRSGEVLGKMPKGSPRQNAPRRVETAKTNGKRDYINLRDAQGPPHTQGVEGEDFGQIYANTPDPDGMHGFVNRSYIEDLEQDIPVIGHGEPEEEDPPLYLDMSGGTGQVEAEPENYLALTPSFRGHPGQGHQSNGAEYYNTRGTDNSQRSNVIPMSESAAHRDTESVYANLSPRPQ